MKLKHIAIIGSLFPILFILMEKAFQHTFGFFQLVSDPLWNLLF